MDGGKSIRGLEGANVGPKGKVGVTMGFPDPPVPGLLTTTDVYPGEINRAMVDDRKDKTTQRPVSGA